MKKKRVYWIKDELPRTKETTIAMFLFGVSKFLSKDRPFWFICPANGYAIKVDAIVVRGQCELAFRDVKFFKEDIDIVKEFINSTDLLCFVAANKGKFHDFLTKQKLWATVDIYFTSDNVKFGAIEVGAPMMTYELESETDRETGTRQRIQADGKSVARTVRSLGMWLKKTYSEVKTRIEERMDDDK